MPRILIVSLHAGEGHVKAAEGLEQAFHAKHPEALISRIDFFDYSSKIIQKLYGDLYLLVAKRTPKFHNFLYELFNVIKSRKAAYGRILFDYMNARPFLKYVNEFNPDAIVATHPIPAGLIGSFYKKKIPLVEVITDYEFHQLWIDPAVSLYIVATDEVRDEFIREGVESEKIVTLGIPVRQEFWVPKDQKKMRKELGLEDQFTVFVLAGAFGVSPVEKILETIRNLSEKFQLVVVAGRNQELFKRLEKTKKEFPKPLHVFGYTDKIPDLMSASDVLISKAGGLTVTESLARGVPMLLIQGFAGQEEANSRYLLKNGCALRASRLEDIPLHLERLMNDPELLKNLQENIKRVARPHSSLDAVEVIWKKIENTI